jgi:PRC-barrel domain
MFALAPTDIDWFLNVRSVPVAPNANFWTLTPWSTRGLKLGDLLYFLCKSSIRKIGGWGAFSRYVDMAIDQGWTDEMGSSTQWTRRLPRLSLSIVTKKKNGREATPTLASLARRFLCGWRRGQHEAAVLVALALLGAQASASAATRDAQPLVRPLSWQLAQAASDSQPNTGAPTSRDDDKNKAEKAGVPATVVDGEQLESVLGIEALSSTGETMGRIVDIVVDRSGQIRAAIIDFGGFLGVGSRKIAVDWRSLHFEPKKTGLVVANLTKDQLRVAPVYKAAEPVVMIGGPDMKP